MVIKKTKCKCGKEYIDFDNQLGSCPDCRDPGKHLAVIEQKILKQFTYMPVEAALRLVLRLLAQERWDRDQEKNEGTVPLPTLIAPGVFEASGQHTGTSGNDTEARGLCAYIKKVFRRK